MPMVFPSIDNPTVLASMVVCLAALIAVLILVGKVSIASPPVAFAAIFAAAHVGGYYLDLDSLAGFGFSKQIAWQFPTILAKIVLCLMAFCMGALILSLRSKGSERVDATRLLADKLKEISLGQVFAATFIALAAFTLGSGVEDLFERNGYMVEQVKLLKILGNPACLVCALLLGAQAGKSAMARVACLAMFATIFIVLLGYSTRGCVVALLLFAFGYNLVNPSKWSKAWLALAALSAPFCMQIPLYMRALPMQGLLPLADELQSGRIWANLEIDTVLNDFLFDNFKITALTAILGDIDIGYVITGLNPLPGFMTDWYALPKGIAAGIPYTSIGEMISFSMWFALGFYFFMGVLFAYVTNRANRGDLVYLLVGVPVLFLYTVLSLQYTTRSSVRVLYYFAAALLVRWVFLKLARRLSFADLRERNMASTNKALKGGFEQNAGGAR
jgi:hypothetical protein